MRSLTRASCVSLATLFALGLLLGTPSVTQAEEVKATEEFPDRFMIRGGWNYVFNADTTFNINGSSGIGTSIDFARTLGGQREDSLWRIDSLYRFNPRHSVGFSYYDVTRKGNRMLDAALTIRRRHLRRRRDGPEQDRYRALSVLVQLFVPS